MLLFVPNLQQGGAERQILELMTRLPPRFETTLCLYEDVVQNGLPPRGHHGGHAWEPRVVPSALDAARRARVEDARRRSTTWCARAPQRGMSRRDSPMLLT